MDSDPGQPRRPLISAGNVLTFVGMIAVALSVYYNGSGQTNSEVAALRTDMSNAKSTIEQLRSDINQLHTENVQTQRDFASGYDRLKDAITEIKVLVSKDGRVR